jgi:RNA polymerase sigma factor (sigma-70 family)
MTPTPATDNRPMGYDAKVLAHMPLIRRIAKSWCSRHPKNGEVEDFIQDTVAEAFRTGHLYDGRYEFSTWIFFATRSVIDQRRKARPALMPLAESVPARQHDYAELSEALRRLSGTRASDMLVRHAMGDDFAEIGAAFGITRQRAHQLVRQERAALVARMAA